MVVIVDNKRPTGVGESLSGAKAFYVSAAMIEDWHAVEQHPEFRRLDADEREDVKYKFPVSAQRYKAIWSTRFVFPRSSHAAQ
jgi:hypothetical protein